MDSVKSIVIAVDFSDYSERALEHGVRIARAHGAAVRVVHVVEELALADLEQALPKLRGRIREDVVDSARRRLSERVAQAGAETAGCDVRVGFPVLEILRTARDANADLLVLGTNSTSRPASGPGTLATKCARKAGCDVLLCRADHRGPFRRITACVDFSPASLRAAREAARLARVDGATLEILHVSVAPWKVLHFDALGPDADADLDRRYRMSLDRLMEEFLQPLCPSLEGLDVSRAVVESRSASLGVVDRLARTGADLAVVGTQGRSALMTMLVGTTAERVVRESPCSVLAVKPEGFAYRID